MSEEMTLYTLSGEALDVDAATFFRVKARTALNLLEHTVRIAFLQHRGVDALSLEVGNKFLDAAYLALRDLEFVKLEGAFNV